MFYKKWKSEIFTIPNLLSLFRLALIPIYIKLYLNAREPRQFYTAGTILAISCLTDALDGQIARRFHMISIVGKILDPLADKITQLALIFCLVFRHPVLKPVLMLFVIKELFQILLGILYLQQGKMLPGALPAGKICTAVLFASLTLLVLFPDIHGNAVKMIALTDFMFLSISLLGYYFAYFGKYKKIRKLNAE